LLALLIVSVMNQYASAAHEHDWVVKELGVPLYGQETDSWCWNASTQMVLAYHGSYYSQEYIAAVAGKGPHDGATDFETMDTIRRLGYNPTWQPSWVWSIVLSEIDGYYPFIS